MLKKLKNFFVAKNPLAHISSEYLNYNKSRYNKDFSSLCFAPSVNMLFSQTGEVQVCCHNMEYVIGKYPEQSISEIWNSKKAEKLRDEMKSYRLYEGCKICKADIVLGAFDEVAAKHFDSLPRNKNYPTMMEFLISNTCNLECIMCKGEYSSLIRQNREKLPPIQTPYDEVFVEQLREFIPYLHETRFSGSGEAFLIDLNYKIWEMIIAINPKCLIMVQTNGMVLNERIKNLLSRGNFQIGVSIDSLKKEVYETIRPHGKLERVMENINYFSEYSQKKKMKFSVALCVMRQNWEELPAFVKYANSVKATATFHKVWHPMEYSLKPLSALELSNIVEYLNNHFFESNTHLEKKNEKHYKYIVSVIEKWYQESVAIESKKVDLSSFSNTQLMECIKRNAKKFFEDSFNTSSTPKILYNEFCNKIDMLIEKFENADLKKQVLVQLYITEFKQVYSSFEKFSLDELYMLSQKHIFNK